MATSQDDRPATAISEATTATALAQEPLLDNQFPGVNICDPMNFKENRKRTIAGYCGFADAAEYWDFYDPPDAATPEEEADTFRRKNIRAFMVKFYEDSKNNFSINTNRKSWNPMQAFGSYFYRKIVIQVHLDLPWVRRVRHAHFEGELPLNKNNFPTWYRAPEAGPQADIYRYHVNLLAYALHLMSITHGQFCDMEQPHSYHSHHTLDFTNEDLHRHVCLLRAFPSGRRPTKRISQWAADPPKFQALEYLGEDVVVSRKEQILDVGALDGSIPDTLDVQLFYDDDNRQTMSRHAAFEPGQIYNHAEEQVYLARDATRPPMSSVEEDHLRKWLGGRAKIARRGTSLMKHKELEAGLQEKQDEFEQKISNIASAQDSTDLKDMNNDTDDYQQEHHAQDTEIDRAAVYESVPTFTPTFQAACQRVGYAPDDRRPSKSPLQRLHHQVIGTAWAVDKEQEALPVLIIGDECGLGKTITCLDIVEAAARDIDLHNETCTAEQEKRQYGITLVIAPASVFGNWYDDAVLAYPPKTEGQPSDGPVVSTFYSQAIKGARNFCSLQTLMAYLDTLDPYDPATGRVVIATTYGTWRQHAMSENEHRRQQRNDVRKRRSKRNPDVIVDLAEEAVEGDIRFEDFTANFNLQNVHIARTFLDEGHAIKNPRSLTSFSVRLTPTRVLYIVSATVLSNSIDDIFGISFQLDKFILEKDDYFVTSAIECLQKQDAVQCVRQYQTLEASYTQDVTCYESSHTFPDSASHVVRNDYHPGWWMANGQTASERYGLHLFTTSAIKCLIGPLRKTLTTDADKLRHIPESIQSLLRSGRERDSPALVKLVVSMPMRLMSISRTRTSKIEIGRDEQNGPIYVTPAQQIPPYQISTFDICHTPSSALWYKHQIAEVLHAKRVIRLSEGSSGGGCDSILDGGVDRLIQLGSFCPGLCYVGIRTILARRYRLRHKEEPPTDEQLLSGACDKSALECERYPLPHEWQKWNDNCATALYLLFDTRVDAEPSFNRLVMLQQLLRDSPKAVVLVREILRLHAAGRKIIVFCSWPVQQIYIEALLSLLDIPTISLHGHDTMVQRRAKARMFNTVGERACVFVSMWTIGAQGINLHYDCADMIIVDIVPGVPLILQMAGRLIRTGQKRQVSVSILALECSYDMKRQAMISAKMVGILAGTSHTDVAAPSHAGLVGRQLRILCEERVRMLQGQSCSRLEWDVRKGEYLIEYNDGTYDLSIHNSVWACERILEDYQTTWSNVLTAINPILHSDTLWPDRPTIMTKKRARKLWIDTGTGPWTQQLESAATIAENEAAGPSTAPTDQEEDADSEEDSNPEEDADSEVNSDEEQHTDEKDSEEDDEPDIDENGGSPDSNKTEIEENDDAVDDEQKESREEAQHPLGNDENSVEVEWDLGRMEDGNMDDSWMQEQIANANVTATQDSSAMAGAAAADDSGATQTLSPPSTDLVESNKRPLDDDDDDSGRDGIVAEDQMASRLSLSPPPSKVPRIDGMTSVSSPDANGRAVAGRNFASTWRLKNPFS